MEKRSKHHCAAKITYPQQISRLTALAHTAIREPVHHNAWTYMSGHAQPKYNSPLSLSSPTSQSLFPIRSMPTADTSSRIWPYAASLLPNDRSCGQ